MRGDCSTLPPTRPCLRRHRNQTGELLVAQTYSRLGLFHLLCADNRPLCHHRNSALEIKVKVGHRLDILTWTGCPCKVQTRCPPLCKPSERNASSRVPKQPSNWACRS